MAAVRESCAVWKTLRLVRICTFAVSSTKVPGERVFGARGARKSPGSSHLGRQRPGNGGAIACSNQLMTQRSTGRPPHPDRDQLQRLQAERLRQLVAAVIPGNRFWSRKFADAGCRPEHLQAPADLTRLPTTQKKELLEDQRATQPYGTNLTESVERYSRLHQTSGTSSIRSAGSIRRRAGIG